MWNEPADQLGIMWLVLWFLWFINHLTCKNVTRYGKVDDGGWDLCVSEPFTLAFDDCLVYSFGYSLSFNISINIQ